jgi:hypothetical protein
MSFLTVLFIAVGALCLTAGLALVLVNRRDSDDVEDFEKTHIEVGDMFACCYYPSVRVVTNINPLQYDVSFNGEDPIDGFVLYDFSDLLDETHFYYLGNIND